MEELIFHWGLEGYSAEIFKITEDGKERFIMRYSSMDFDEHDNEIWRQGEVKYSSFDKYWEEFTSQEGWFLYHLVFLHNDYKPFVREFLSEIPQDSLTKGELLKLLGWFDKIGKEG